MKKALIASLISYIVLLLSVVVMMVIYIILDKQTTTPISAESLKALFTTVSVFFGLFVLMFVAVIILIVMYPKVVGKEYRVKIEPIIKEHVAKYGDKPGRVYVVNKDKTVIISFIMEEEKDTYSFELKEKPLTKSEVSRMSLNCISEIYGATV